MSRTEKDAPYWVKHKRAAIDRDLAKKITSSNFTETRTYEVKDFEEISAPGSFRGKRDLIHSVLEGAEVVGKKFVATVKAEDKKDGKTVELVRQEVVNYVNSLLKLSPSRSFSVDDFNAIKDPSRVYFSIGDGYVVAILSLYNRYDYFFAYDNFYSDEPHISFEVRVFYVEKLAQGENKFKYNSLIPGVFNKSNFRDHEEFSKCSCPWCMYDLNKYRGQKKLGLLGGSKSNHRAHLNNFAKVFNARNINNGYQVDTEQHSKLEILSDYIDGIDVEDSLNEEDFILPEEDETAIFDGDYENPKNLSADISIPREVLELVNS